MERCSIFWGLFLSRRSSYDDTHVHYGPGGTSNASAYGLQNGRVRNMLRSQVALLKLHTLKVEQSLTLSLGFAAGWKCGRHDCRRRLEGAAG